MGAESRADVLCLPHNHTTLSFSYWHSHFPLWRFRQHPLLTFTASLAAMTKFWPRRPEETSGKILSPDENRHYKSRKWFPQQWAPYAPPNFIQRQQVCVDMGEGWDTERAAINLFSYLHKLLPNLLQAHPPLILPLQDCEAGRPVTCWTLGQQTWRRAG